MPRTYVRKKPPPPYTPEDLKAACDAVTGGMAYKRAECIFKIPASVIFHRLKGRRSSLQKIGQGGQCFLGKETEDALAECLKQRAKMGHPCSVEEVQELVQEFLGQAQIKTRFKNGKPGPDWYYGFMKRYKSILSLKKAEPLEKQRKLARKPQIVYDFFDKLEQIASEFEVSDASFVFNADESGFNLDPSKLRAIGIKGKPLNRITGGSGRESVTVLACVAADGSKLPPLIVYKGAAVQPRWTSSEGFHGTLYGASSKGWMEEPQFFHWFSNAFVSHVNQKRAEKGCPNQFALLVFDGHVSHRSVRIIDAALKNKIHILKFPSHLTDKIQPLDKCVFGPLKVSWEKKLVAYGKSQIGKGTGRLPKNQFAKILGELWREIPENNVISGFVSTGVFPVDRTKFPRDLFNQEELSEYENSTLLALPSTTHRVGPTLPNTNAIACFAEAPTPACSAEASTPACSAEASTPTCSAEASIPACSSSMDTPTKNAVVEVFRSLVESMSVKKSLGFIDVASSPQSTTNILKTVFDVPDEAKQAPKQVTPRLKQLAYGEVLTSGEVLERLKEAEDKKKAIASNKQVKKETAHAKKKQKIALKKDDSSGSDMEDENSDVENLEEVGEVKVNDWVLVEYKGAKGLLYYTGQVTSLEGSDIVKINFLKRKNRQYVFPGAKDEDNISVNSIKKIMPAPNIRRGYYTFNIRLPAITLV